MGPSLSTNICSDPCLNPLNYYYASLETTGSRVLPPEELTGMVEATCELPLEVEASESGVSELEL